MVSLDKPQTCHNLLLEAGRGGAGGGGGELNCTSFTGNQGCPVACRGARVLLVFTIIVASLQEAAATRHVGAQRGLPVSHAAPANVSAGLTLPRAGAHPGSHPQ